jgi:polyhydroxybutyrate depolymerase
MRVFISVLMVVWASVAVAQGECHADVPCVLVDGRTYHVKAPDGWDGVTPLPVMLHFHGWGRQGTLIVKHMRISGATRRRGVLLLAPNGAGKTWDFWRSDTDDVAFGERVLADAAKRYPIDRSNVFVSGYSYGSAMAWRFACETDLDVRAVLAVSGTLRQTTECSGAPREVRHVHGLTDTVMDFPMGQDGDETYPVALWRRQFGCGDARAAQWWGNVPPIKYKRTVWDDCAGGRRVVLDVHPSGHFIPKGWFARQLDELLGREPKLP